MCICTNGNSEIKLLVIFKFDGGGGEGGGGERDTK